MSNNYTAGSEGGTLNNGSSFVSRREIRASNVTGALPILSPIGIERGLPGSFDFEQMILSLHDLFEHDRQVASQPDATRCGICYLHFPVNELNYREEGHYVCHGCAQALGHHKLPMLHKQQKM